METLRSSPLLLALLLALLVVGCDFGDGIGVPRDVGPRPDGALLDGSMGRIDAGPPPDRGVDMGPEPCADVTCDVGERCEVMGDTGTCVPNTCADLSCPVTERCEPAPSGPGNVCVDNTCTDDVGCPEDRWCDLVMGICQEDGCDPGEVQCNGQAVEECPGNGSMFSEVFVCGSAAYFESLCTEAAGEVFCPCEDDWDCPGFTECDVDTCVGTGQEPSCFLEPADFSEVLPDLEPGFPWGGTGIGEEAATGSPFPDSSQVVMTPLVANLDDDNGDGRIDERDFPEIIFMTFCDSSFTDDGTLRAIHGGGANPGADFFASCGSNLWQEGDDVGAVSCPCSSGDLDPTATAAVGDLDGDGVPEIVAVRTNERIQIYANTGEVIGLSGEATDGGNQAVSIANVDGVGFAEIIVGRDVFTLDRVPGGDFVFLDRFRGTLGRGVNSQGPISCVADLDGDGRQEIIGGTTAYRFPPAPAGLTSRAECSGSETGSEATWCAGALEVLWDGEDENGGTVDRNGFCAVADVWGADRDNPPGPTNPPDDLPEVVVVNAGRLQIFAGDDGELLFDVNLNGSRGGAPNIDDFDGDGFPEIGTAFSQEYVLVDLQPPTADCPDWDEVYEDGVEGLQGNDPRSVPGGACTNDSACGDTSQFACNEVLERCVCLHNGWRRGTEDNSSQVTGSSVFDFNGDGSAEVVYNDECFFRIYAGLDGTVEFKENSPSRTRTENPVVADVDNDGNAEIVFAASNESGFCSEGNDFNNGIEVWGDQSDTWVSARRIYNQHSYHVTNVFESGGIPSREPEGWLPYSGRLYNSYRSQPRNPFILAPDLEVAAVQLTSPNAACGTLSTIVDITVRVVNNGDTRVGPGVNVGFAGRWTTPPLTEALFADMSMTPLLSTLTTPLEPGESVFLTVRYDAANNAPGELPDEVTVTIDPEDAERECEERNNDEVVPVMGGAAVADLAVEIGTVSLGCPDKDVETTVRNDGSVAASNFVVRYFAGNPEAGGTVLHEELVPGPLAPGESTTFTTTIEDFPGRSVIIFAVVDPDDAVTECNDGNNTDATDDRFDCFG